jgi:hypothetical protein
MGDASKHRAITGPLIRLVAAEDERTKPLRCVLAEGESEASSPRETEVVSSFDFQLVEDGDGIGYPSPQCIGSRFMWLVALSLAAMVGKDQAVLTGQSLAQW